MTIAKPGPGFGKSTFLTPQGDSPSRGELVVSPDGKFAAFTKPIPAFDKAGKRLQTYTGADFLQIFVIDLPNVP